MSLVGNLEDLGLGDILQIVSLSRKSGTLNLHSRGREGMVVFRNGQVVQASSSVVNETLGDLLLRKGVVDMAVLKRALLLQESGVVSSRLGTVLAERFGVSAAAVDEVVKEQIERVVYSFFAWNEGTFAFELGEEPAKETPAQPSSLERGLNPQWLAMEGSRLLDERRHRGEVLDDDLSPPEAAPSVAAENTVSTSSVPQVERGAGLFLVDDDNDFRQRLAHELGPVGFHVSDFRGGGEALTACRREAPSVWLVDLLMPRMDGSGVLGGLELAERVATECPASLVLVMSDHPNPEAEARLGSLGVKILAKPRYGAALGDDPDALSAFAAEVAGSCSMPGRVSPPLYDLGAELMREMGEPGRSVQSKGPESPGLPLLKGMLQELQNPSLGGGITLLILRFASELMNRAVIFLAKDAAVVGLGQFGIELPHAVADERVRRMKIPLSDESIFQVALREKAPSKVRLGNGLWDNYLREQLGGDDPAEVFLGPVISEGNVVAMLYGDNLPDRTAIGDTSALEIFLSQAGLAMEKALLERRLNGRPVP